VGRKYYILSYFIITSALIFCSIPLTVKAVEDTKPFMTNADSFVGEENPDTNFGGYTYLKVGYDNNWSKAFLKFDLINVPSIFHKAELRIAFLHVENNSLLDFYETNSGWGEYSITWNNAPPFGDLITSVSIPEGQELYKHVKIDITDKLESITGFWSIGINSSIQKLVRIAPKEQAPVPLIMFYYQTSDILMFSKIILVGSLGLVIIAVAFYQASIKKK